MWKEDITIKAFYLLRIAISFLIFSSLCQTTPVLGKNANSTIDSKKASSEKRRPVKVTGRVGPLGSVFELQGVAVIKVPEGALTEYEMISIEELEAPHISDNELLISSVVKVSLSGSKNLKKKILVRLSINKKYVGKNHPGIIEYYQPVTCAVPEDDFCTISLDSPDRLSETTFESFYILEDPSSVVYATIRKMYINQEFEVLDPSMPLLPEEIPGLSN